MKTEQQVARILSEALSAYLTMRDGGTPKELALKSLELTFREYWPFSREWKYLCDECQDTGLRMERRTFRIYGDELMPVGVPCWCQLGRRFKEKPKTETDFTQAGKVSKPMMRMGR